MTIFTATKPVNLSPAGLTPLIQDVFNLSSIIETHTASEFKVESSDLKVEFDFQSAAGDLTYNAFNLPTGGTVSSLIINTDTGGGLSQAYSFTDMSVSVARIEADVLTGTPASIRDVLAAIFPGHDVLNGSPEGGDYLPCFARHDTVNPGPNDTMDGAPGNDTFVFHPGFGNDVIDHFITKGLKHDVIALISLPLHNFHQVLTHSHIVHHELVIRVDATDTITLSNVHSKTALIGADFHFHA